MGNNEEKDLERHLKRISSLIDGWDETERRTRAEKLKRELVEAGVRLDEEAIGIIEEFCAGSIGFEEMSRFFQGKIP